MHFGLKLFWIINEAVQIKHYFQTKYTVYLNLYKTNKRNKVHKQLLCLIFIIFIFNLKHDSEVLKMNTDCIQTFSRESPRIRCNINGFGATKMYCYGCVALVI